MQAPCIFRLLLGVALAAWTLGPAPAHGAVTVDVDQAGLAVVDVPEGGSGYVNGAVLCLARTAAGSLFIGSNRLAEFDGGTWRRWEVPGATRFLSLAADARENRLWVAADGAMGYLKRGALGDWSFVSLAAEAGAAGVNLSEIRYVQAIPGGAIFVSRWVVMRWDGRAFSTWSLPAPIRLYPFPDRDELYIYQPGVGLLRLERDGPRLRLREEDLPAEAPIVGYFGLAGDDGIAVFSNEVYRLESGRWVHLDEASRAIRGKLAYCATRLENGDIAIGTLYEGASIVRPDGSFVRQVSTQSGLPDDCANVLLPDGGGQLWIGTATGIARLSHPEQAFLYDQRVGLASGIVRRVFRQDGRPTVVTSHRVYTLRANPPAIVAPARPSSVGAYWTMLRDAVLGEGEIWAGGTGGVWRVTASATLREPRSGGEVHRLLATQFPPRGILALGGPGSLAWRSGTGWTALEVDQPGPASGLSAVEDTQGRIWISGAGGDVSAYRWDEPDGRLSLLARYSPGRGLPAAATRPTLSLLDGTLLAFTESDTLALDPSLDRFVPVAGLGEHVVLAVSPPSGPVAYWAVQVRRFGSSGPQAIVRVGSIPGKPGTFRLTPVVTPGLDRLGEVTSLSVTEEAGERDLWIGGVNTLLRIHSPDSEPAAPPPGVTLHRVTLDDRALPALPGSAPARVPHDASRLAFEFGPGGPATNDSAILYETRLDGVEAAWSPAQAQARREFTGLAPGDYAFFVRAVDRFGRSGAPLRYPFAVSLPWYRSPAMMAGWALLAALLLVTGMRYRERRLTLQTERLNRLVNERTRELSLSNTAKSEFLEGISHEIHDPLYGIVGLANLIDQGGLPESQRQYARSLRECSQSLIRVFDDVLNFSKLQYGFVPLDEGPFLAADLLRSVRDLFLGTAAGGGGTLSVRIPDDFADGFWGDAAKIRTILSNFVSNALKYAPGTPVELAVSTMEESGTKASILFEVADGGPGIPPEEQELIFRKFVRGSLARQSKIAGTGIGLATCRALAQLLGGSVGLECPPGRGTVFYLKVRLDRQARMSPPAAAERPAGEPWALIVEDQAYNQVILAGLLGKLGYRIETARDADGALAAAAARNFSLTFIDLELPKVGGIELARSLRGTPGGGGSTLIGMSANDSPDVPERALAAGMDAFILKPLTEEKIRSVLGGRPSPGRSGGVDAAAFELYARSLRGGLAEARRSYGDALRSEIGLLREAAALGAPDGIARAAHRVRSHAAIVGAAGLGRAAGVLEGKARAGAGQLGESDLEAVYRESAELERTLSEPDDPTETVHG